MPRPRRKGSWTPLTARLDEEAARRLRVAAARMDLTQGEVLDRLIMANLPPVDPLARPDAGGLEWLEPVTVEWLREAMGRVGLNQSDLARGIKITPKAVSEWFERNRVPPQRWREVRKLIAKAAKARG